MPEQEQLGNFEQIVLPHLGAAYNLARWLTRNDHDAEDVVQEAYLRALKFFAGLRGNDARTWLLTVVRNTCYTWMERQRGHGRAVPLESVGEPVSADLGPEQLLLQKDTGDLVRAAVAELPVEFREVIVLRELEGLSYKEIAAVVGAPLGTVMSRLTRGRARLQELLATRLSKEPSP